MKKFIRLQIIFFSFTFSCLLSSDSVEHLLAVVIMVKNEVDVIVPTLKPFVDKGIQSFLVYDTGSNDGTQQTIQNYFAQSGLTDAHLIEEPFIDFGTSRSRALDLAENIFTDATFLLMIDAEWYTHNVQELLNFCKTHKDHIAPGYTGSCYLMHLFTADDSIDNYVIRLIRKGHNVRYEGPVHETITAQPSGIVPNTVYFEYAPQKNGKKKSQERFARDYELLYRKYEKNRTDTRTLFYLGQTCQFLNDWHQAIFFYKKRLEIGQESEEKYLAAYRIGYAIEYIIEEKYRENNLKNDVSKLESGSKDYTWKDALGYYLKAHQMMPHRAEPLFRIACRYIRNNEHATAYLFALRASQLPFPERDSLFVEKKIYDYLRYDILGQCAIYAGEPIIGKAAVLKAMETAPDDPCLHHNLAIYNHYVS